VIEGSNLGLGDSWGREARRGPLRDLKEGEVGESFGATGGLRGIRGSMQGPEVPKSPIQKERGGILSC
jgi:hypothetical protein